MNDADLEKLAKEWFTKVHNDHEADGYQRCPNGVNCYEEFWICSKCASPEAGYVAAYKACEAKYAPLVELTQDVQNYLSELVADGFHGRTKELLERASLIIGEVKK